MAGAIVEVKYFNSFVLKKTNNNGVPIWNGSFGIPKDLGGYKVVTNPASTVDSWAIEEARIRGGYNNTTVDFGVKAYLVDDEPQAINKTNGLIYSGIFNSRTGVNNTNVFSVGKDITKSTDPSNGSIQKLYAEDTNLVVFQENKVSKALIDKDAIYSAEGGGSVTSSNLVIGQIVPYSGEFGISKNPESFAVYGYAKYFSDKKQNVILRLSSNGITPISSYGMKDFFRDELNTIDTSSSNGRVIGGYDIHTNQYIVSLQQNIIKNPSSEKFSTLSFDEKVSGWTSFYSYKPDQMFSLRNKFYSLKNGSLYEHHDQYSLRGRFYSVQNVLVNYPSTITSIFNPSTGTSKTFKTIEYEGSNGWKVNSFVSDTTGATQATGGSYTRTFDTSSQITSYYEGEYIINPNNGQAVERSNYNSTFGTADPPYPRIHAGFDRKENKYVANIINNSLATEGEITWGSSVSGIRGFYTTVTLSTDTTTNLGGEKQLFSIGSAYTINNGY
jgi:hypothetical protein